MPAAGHCLGELGLHVGPLLSEGTKPNLVGLSRSPGKSFLGRYLNLGKTYILQLQLLFDTPIFLHKRTV